jgi:hypothetical protein
MPEKSTNVMVSRVYLSVGYIGPRLSTNCAFSHPIVLRPTCISLGLNRPMLVRLRLKNLSGAGLCLLRRDVLVKPKEVAWIIARFNTYEAFPPFEVGLGYAVIFIAAHEIDVHPRSHRGT